VRRCVSGKRFSIAPGATKTITASLARACRRFVSQTNLRWLNNHPQILTVRAAQ
jgi:hypothetical protein